MAKSLVEKYEQILASDPASTVFVELAKALLEKGDNNRAIQVCEQGLQHHAQSVVGRVLWGKALIGLGRPAEAMEQFDKAIAINRENPHAYNLIGEVLLHKGLYRSALPLLRKAVALQPNDGRVRQWLEQTQAALAGGPAPILADFTKVDAQSPGAAEGMDPSFESTQVGIDAYVPQTPVNEVPGEPATLQTEVPKELQATPARRPQTPHGAEVTQVGPAPAAPVAPVARPAQEVTQVAAVPQDAAPPAPPPDALQAPPEERTVIVRTSSGELPVFDPAALAPAEADGAPPPPPVSGDDPFAAAPKRTSSAEQVIGGLTGTFDALSQSAQEAALAGAPPPPESKPQAAKAADDPFDAVVKRSQPVDDSDRGPTVRLQVPAELGGAPDEPSVRVSSDIYREARLSGPNPVKGGLLDELPTPAEDGTQPAAPLPRAPAAAAAPPPPARPRKSGGLLDDLPDLPEPTSSLEVPKVEVSTQAAEAIAREYERELREKLAQSKARKSFLARHWLKLSVAGVAVVAIGVGIFMFARTTVANQGSLADALAEAKKAVLQDTRTSYATALDALARAVRMDEDSVEAWALTAYANAVLYSEHGRKAEHRKAAEAALTRAGVREKFPAMTQAALFHLAEGKAREDRGKELVASSSPAAEINELAGRILLEKGDTRGAIKRFQSALADNATSVRVLVALGDYYRSSGDYPKALEFYSTAKEISPRHPARVLGAAESRLELSRDLSEALAEVETLPPDAELNEELQARKLLAQGRLLAETADAARGVQLLEDGARRFKLKGFEFGVALGHANRKAGRMGAAEAALDSALKLRPRSEDARELLARVLIERDRAREALSKVPQDQDSRRISLVRGVAYAKVGDWRRARAELERTQIEGKFPSEAVIWLAMADAKTGKEAEAQKVLEKLLSVTKKARSEVLVALGDIHVQKGELDKAKARYEEASKEPDDVEGACAYGRMLLGLGFPKLAVEPLQRAAKRNDSHNEAQEALGRALLQLGRVKEAVELAKAWEIAAERPPAARRLHALALYMDGQLKEADKAATLAIRADSRSPEAWRTRSMVNFAQGDAKTGFKDLERSNKLDPKDSDTFCEIGFAFLRLGNRENANAAFGAAVRENKDVPCGQTGLIYSELPRASRRSLGDLAKLGEDAPAAWDRAFAHFTRSRVLLALGRAKEAKQAAEQGVKLAPWSGPAHLALGLAQLKLKEDAATQTLAKAVELDPVNGNIRLAYADALVRGDDAEQTKALDEYQRFLRIGGDEDDERRVERTLKTLKKRLASR